MKRVLTALATIAFLCGASAMAEGEHGSITVAEMQTLTGLAINDFAQANPDHVQHLTGWKTWRSNADIKVKLYVNHDGMNMEYNYNCHKHGDGKLQCHQQQ